LIGTALFNEASTVYLVTQAGISELRNSNRILTEFFHKDSPKLEVVINQYEPNSQGLTDEHITKALNRPVQWKIPDNCAAARQILNSTTPGTLVDSPVSRPIRQMARSTCGLPPLPEKTIGSRLRSLTKNGAEKNSTAQEPQANADVVATVAWSTPEPIVYGTKLNGTHLGAGGIRLHASGRLHLAAWSPYALGDLHTGGLSWQRSCASLRVDHCHKGNASHQMAGAARDCMRHCAQ
jgi:hypothetical protein